MNLDLYDKKIIYLLLTDSRRPATDIAKRIRLSKESVYYRIKRLVNCGYIKNFYTLINASYLGYQYYRIYIKLKNHADKTEDKIIEYLKADRSCADLDILEGYYDLTFLTMQKTPGKLNLFMENFCEDFGAYIKDKAVHSILKLHILTLGYPDKMIHDHKVISYEEPNKINYTDFEINILNQMARQSRIQTITISRRLKSDPSLVRYHIRKLEKSGIISGYSASLNMEKFGKIPIQINFTLSQHKIIPKLLELLSKLNKSIWAYETFGDYDLSVKIVIDDMESILKLLGVIKRELEEKIISYDISHVYTHYIINLSPFEAVNNTTGKII